MDVVLSFAASNGPSSGSTCPLVGSIREAFIDHFLHRLSIRRGYIFLSYKRFGRNADHLQGALLGIPLCNQVRINMAGLIFRIYVFLIMLISPTCASPVFAPDDDGLLAPAIIERVMVQEQAAPSTRTLHIQADRRRVPSLVLANTSLATAWLEMSQPVGLASKTTHIIYSVPGTPTKLIIRVYDMELPERAMGDMLLRVMNYAARRIEQRGDSVLLKREDPYWIDLGAGVVFGAWSLRGATLKYSELASTARGIWSTMYLQGKYQPASVAIYNRDRGRAQRAYAVIRQGSLQRLASDA